MDSWTQSRGTSNYARVQEFEDKSKSTHLLPLDFFLWSSLRAVVKAEIIRSLTLKQMYKFTIFERLLGRLSFSGAEKYDQADLRLGNAVPI